MPDEPGVRELLLESVKDIRADIRELRNDIDDVKESVAKTREDVSGLKVKSGLIGAIAGTLVFIGSTAIEFFRGLIK